MTAGRGSGRGGGGGGDGREKWCARCGRRIEWRKKWERDWASVKYCSSSCKRAGVSAVDRELEETMLGLLRERGIGKSICPSEAARAVALGLRGGVGEEESWRALMEPSRMAARRLVARGVAEVTQQGRPIDPSTATGPIRVRLRG